MKNNTQKITRDNDVVAVDDASIKMHCFLEIDARKVRYPPTSKVTDPNTNEMTIGFLFLLADK